MVKPTTLLRKGGNRLPHFALVPCLVLIVLTLACSRFRNLPSTGEATSGLQPSPFGRLADAKGVSPTATFLPASAAAGTQLTVRLQDTLSSAYSHAGDSFRAVLEEPIVVQGEIVAPRGAQVTGRVSAVAGGDLLGAPGYLRLTLTAISINGSSVALQTSSVFAKAGPREKLISTKKRTSQRDVQFNPDRQLIFRLVQPLWLGS